MTRIQRDDIAPDGTPIPVYAFTCVCGAHTGTVLRSEWRPEKLAHARASLARLCPAEAAQLRMESLGNEAGTT